MHEQQARLNFIRVIDTIDVDTDSLLHQGYLVRIIRFREGNFAGSFLCQFVMKVNERYKHADCLEAGYCPPSAIEGKGGCN
jgi:hypothetical protein